MGAVAKRTHLWERDPLDWYVEPESVTDALLTVERFPEPIWDPACGQGNIVRALRRAGLNAVGSDLVAREGAAGESWFMGERDFLEDLPLFPAATIITNPPFFRAKGAESFIRRALSVAEKRTVAAFVDIRFLAGFERADDLWRACRPDRVWIVTPRVSCPPGSYLAAGNKAGNGSSDWCWLVWGARRTGRTELGWLRRET